MKRFPLPARIAVAAVLLAAIPLIAQGPDASRVPDSVAHRTTPLPDRIVTTWQGDPTRTFSVTWRTSDSVPKVVGQIAKAQAGPGFPAQAKSVDAVTASFTSDLGTANNHSVQFNDLDPETKYVYRVGDGANWSEWIHFQTASEKPEPFSFIYFGDAQNDLKSMWSRVIREAYSDAPKARFMIHAGDLINNANRDAQWGEWFGAGGWLNAMVPSIPTPGNHEYERAPPDPTTGQQSNERRLSRHWRPQFSLPENGPEGLEETVYSVDYQGVRIISLNSNEQIVKQTAWLDKTLAENRNRWTVVTFHHPVFSTAKGRDNKEIREAWKPLFDKYKVDLVLNGHDHGYGRSNLHLGTSARSPESGTVYVVSVSGPKMYNVEPQPWMAKSAEQTQLYQIIHVDGGKLTYEARTAIGDVYDRFELHKQAGRVNRLVEARRR
jgi:hypothetical protein